MEEVQRATANSSLADGDNVQIGARLENLEKGIKDLGAKIESANNSNTGPSLGDEKAPSIVVTELPKQSFANIVAARPPAQKDNVIRPRSNSQKRGIDDDKEGFNVVKKKKVQGKAGKGVFKVATVTENNYEIFVSNVAPQIKNEEMSDIIVDCFDEYRKGMSVEETLAQSEIEVQDMTPAAIADPKRRCWRISVPHRLKTAFEDENYYPSTWKSRQFFPARSNYKRRKSNNEECPSELLLAGGK